MSLEVKNTRQLIEPDKLRLKILIYGLLGSGKTPFLATAPDIGVAACEAGQAKGLASVLLRGLDFVEPSTYQEFDQVCSGLVFKNKASVGLDSLTDMTNTFVKDYALTFPRAKGDTLKRKAGVPELDDYGVMGEVTRRLLRKLIDGDKHVVATATLKIQQPDAETGQGEMLVCPNLPGALALGSGAMFDLVLCLRTRSRLKNSNDPKSRYTEHYITARGTQNLLARCRHSEILGKALLPDEFLLDLNTGEGTFPWIFERIYKGYAEAFAALKKAA